MKWGKVPPPKRTTRQKALLDHEHLTDGRACPCHPVVERFPEKKSKVVPKKGKRGPLGLVVGSLAETALRENKTMYQVRKERAQRKNT